MPGAGWTDGCIWLIRTDTDGRVATAVRHQPQPHNLELFAGYPNPFNSTTIIKYQTAGDAQVNVDIFDIRGHRIRTLVDKRQAAGTHQIWWDGKNDQGMEFPSGVYVCKIKAGTDIKTLKLTLVR